MNNGRRPNAAPNQKKVGYCNKRLINPASTSFVHSLILDPTEIIIPLWQLSAWFVSTLFHLAYSHQLQILPHSFFSALCSLNQHFRAHIPPLLSQNFLLPSRILFRSVTDHYFFEFLRHLHLQAIVGSNMRLRSEDFRMINADNPLPRPRSHVATPPTAYIHAISKKLLPAAFWYGQRIKTKTLNTLVSVGRCACPSYQFSRVNATTSWFHG